MTFNVKSDRTRLIKLIHTGCRALGIGEDERRQMQIDITGKESMTEMHAGDLDKMLAGLKRRGFVPTRSVRADKSGDSLPDGPATRKLRAMWISLWMLGCIDDISDKALMAWIRNHSKWDAAKWAVCYKSPELINALYQWLERPVAEGGGGVEWNTDFPDGVSLSAKPRLAVYRAMLAILGADRIGVRSAMGMMYELGDVEIDTVMRQMAPDIRAERKRKH